MCPESKWGWGGGNRLSRKQPAGKKPSPLSTLANGSVCLGLVSSLGLGEWWKWKSSESQIQGRGSRNKLACPHVHNQQLPGCAGAVGLRGLGHGHDQTALHQHREVWVHGQGGLDHHSTVYLLIFSAELRSVLKIVSHQSRTSCSWQHSCSLPRDHLNLSNPHSISRRASYPLDHSYHLQQAPDGRSSSFPFKTSSWRQVST